MTSVELFEESLEWLKDKYGVFYKEDDLVYVIQRHLIDIIEEKNLPYKIFRDYRIFLGEGKKHADLAILGKYDDENNVNTIVEVAVEFKYEPKHDRNDMVKSKLSQPVVFWDGEDSISKDIERARKYINENKAHRAYSIFIDEGGYFRQNEPFPGSAWQPGWKDIAVLIARF